MINEEALDILIHNINNFVYSEKDKNEINELRLKFVELYNKKRINGLRKEDYFAGLGKKQGCLAYDLEWGTRKLGSIKGGSKYKYGYESDFPKIKFLLQKIILLNTKFYQNDGSLTKDLIDICKLSKDINGFKTGRTVIPKLLSIYYPTAFLPIFNDQDHFLSKLLITEIETENTGLDLYLEYNYRILKIKEKVEDILARKFDNYEFTRLLYFCFPKAELPPQPPSTGPEQEEPSFEALEVQHYQSLLHRNFNKLFPNLKYFDEEEQKPKNGQYDTQTIGIIDMLCQDESGNLIVIEIKRQATDKTIGQILRYIGWVKEELCKEGQNVSGIIVAERKDMQLEFALKAIPNVKFYKLGLNIKIEEQ